MKRSGRITRRWFGLLAILIVTTMPLNATVASKMQPAVCREVYTVQSNDWLSKISDKFLGSIEAYNVIAAATNQQHEIDNSFAYIANPNRLEAGWKLCIPAAEDVDTILARAGAALPAATDLVNADKVALRPPDEVPAAYTLDSFINEFDFGPDVLPQWIRSVPEPAQKYEISPEFQAIQDAYGYRANYLWNSNFGNDFFFHSGIFDVVPDQVKLFPAPSDTVLPRFRYPPNVTLPTGLTTNQYGWRGPQISVKKPDNTIRIAAIGASTTVGGHTLKSSYPEFLQHWLNLWSQHNGYNINFEVINTGREGLNSNDFVAITRYEVLPMDVDYIIYYEGSNQFHPETVVSFPPEYTIGQPPPGVAPNFFNVESEDKSLLDYLSEYSAIAARARSIVEQFLITGAEPPKPEQTFHLPEGQDEFKPNLQKLDNGLALNRIVQHLSEIKQDADSHNVKMVMSTFNWFVYDGMVLDPARHRGLYGYLNRVYWPISYANMRRAADFQNRVFKTWAAENKAPLIDVTARMPRQPDLFSDAIHNTYTGSRIRAWLMFEGLVPLLKQDIEAGNLPRPATLNYRQHPYITGEVLIKVLEQPEASQ